MDGSDVRLREERPGDEAAIAAVIAAAFASEAEARLVEDLRAAEALSLSLVAERDQRIVGHVALSPVTVAGEAGAGRWLGLAPLAVLADHQRQGIGAALVHRAVAVAEERGAAALFVLGRSRYYAPLGFEAAGPLGWTCTYPAPVEAFRVRRLGDPAWLPPAGTVGYHAAFDAL